jgi:hypothetical protein
LEAQIAWLRRSSTAGGAAKNFYIGDLPPTPDEAVGIFEYPGDQSIYFLGGGKPIERPRIQLTVRAPRYDRARLLIHDIYDAVEDKSIVAGGTPYKMRCIGRPGEISPDPENRTLFSLNVMMWRF